MESLLLGLEEELRAAAQAAVQGVVARTRQEVQRVLQAALRERNAGVQEVARLRDEAENVRITARELRLNSVGT